MKTALRTLLAVSFLSLAMPGLSAPPNADGHADGQGNANAGNGGPPPNAPAAPAAAPGPPAADPPGQSQGKPAPAEQSGDDAAPAGQAKTAVNTGAGPSPMPAGPKDQNEAQRAVEERRALPLAKIIKIAETRDKGEVINARLVRVSGVLLYQLTLLNDAGHSWRVYYHALRGNPVVLP